MTLQDYRKTIPAQNFPWGQSFSRGGSVAQTARKGMGSSMRAGEALDRMKARRLLFGGAAAALILIAACSEEPGNGVADSPGIGGGTSGGSSGTGGSGAGIGGSVPGGLGGQGGEPPVPCIDEEPGESDPVAALGQCGRLVYRGYTNQGDDRKENHLPDFSFAGYKRGGVALPEDIPFLKEVVPQAGDDRARIQAAIDEIEALPLDSSGYRGAVLIRKGSYELSSGLSIQASGVVLRGEGQGTDGTRLIATATSQIELVRVSASAPELDLEAATPITTGFVPTGEREFEVESSEGLQVGDAIMVRRTPNQAWIDELGMGTFGWTPGAYAVDHERVIESIEGNTITIDIAIVDPIDENLGGGLVVPIVEDGRIEHVGIEDLRLDSTYASPTDENHGWSAISIGHAKNSFVRRVTVEHFGYAAVRVWGRSAFLTIEDSAHLDPISQITGGRRYPFVVDSGTGVLFQRLYTRNGRHNFVTGARVTGPHVWLDCLAEDSHADDGPHHRWATGLLFDNTRSDHDLNVQNREDSGTGHGWAGAQVVFWNTVSENVRADAPKFAMNFALGVTGEKAEGQWAPSEPDGIWESHNQALTPRSLYLQQLMDRLGESGVLNVTTVAQREGTIFEELSDWAGEGAPEN